MLAQVETAAGVDRVAEIAAVEGVDGIFIGPADLAASMGRLGEPGHPEVRAAIDRARREALAQGKAVGTLATEPASIRQHLEQGASFVAVGVDTALLARAARDLAAAWINPA